MIRGYLNPIFSRTIVFLSGNLVTSMTSIIYKGLIIFQVGNLVPYG